MSQGTQIYYYYFLPTSIIELLHHDHKVRDSLIVILNKLKNLIKISPTKATINGGVFKKFIQVQKGPLAINLYLQLR
jgi:hypothetical protein